MRITTVGSVTRDTLVFPQEDNYRVIRSFGGILYTAIAIASITKETVVPVCNVGFDAYDNVLKILGQFENIDVSRIQKSDTKNIHCHIFYTSDYGTQYDEGNDIPISYKQIQPSASKSDFVFVSPMTGFDITLNTLKKIKKSANCPVYFDYHILSMGRDSLGNRFLLKRADWFEWCTSCDFLQLNEFEAKLLHESSVCSKTSAMDFSKPILNEGVKSVAITLGCNGAIICFGDKRGRKRCLHIAGQRVSKIIDATGCGDVFAAGFIGHYMISESLLGSYHYANKVAALKTQIGGIEGLAGLVQKMNM